MTSTNLQPTKLTGMPWGGAEERSILPSRTAIEEEIRIFPTAEVTPLLLKFRISFTHAFQKARQYLFTDTFKQITKKFIQV